jgi:antitoxin component HigA of HigAB toxin-antitoxin module
MSTDEVRQAAPRAKVLNRERVRFEVAGGNHRLVVAFDFRRQIAFVKFIGTHAEYDRVDVLTASQFSRETRIDIRPIRTDEDHRAALEEIEACWGAAEGTEEGDKLEVLAALVELYEAKRWPVDTAESFDPIDVLRHAIEELGHTQADQSQHRSVPQSASTRDDRGAPAASRGVSSGSRGGQRTLDHIAIAFPVQQTALQYAPCQLLDEQRHAVGTVGDLVNDVVGQCLATSDLRYQRGPVASVKAIEGQPS